MTDETPEETVMREVREELARDVGIMEQIGEAVQYFSVGDRHYRMKAVFYRAAFASEQQGEGEHDLYWLEEREVAASFFHKCHKWAVNQIKH